MTLIDELVYPWPDPVAQELHRTLIALQPSGPPVLLLAQETGIDTAWINSNQPVALLWKDVLEHAAKAHRLGDLIARVLARLSSDHPARPFLQQLMDGGRPALSAEPRAANAQPDFLYADDEVSEPEAMLFGDDLTMPIGQVPGLIDALGRLLAVGPSVCKLTIGLVGGEQYGTAFRIGPDLLLTNWHVVHRRSDGEPAVRVDAEFGFEDDAHRAPLAPRPVRCAAAAVAQDQTDDWAVVRTHRPAGRRVARGGPRGSARTGRGRTGVHHPAPDGPAETGRLRPQPGLVRGRPGGALPHRHRRRFLRLARARLQAAAPSLYTTAAVARARRCCGRRCARTRACGCRASPLRWPTPGWRTRASCCRSDPFDCGLVTPDRSVAPGSPPRSPRNVGPRSRPVSAPPHATWPTGDPALLPRLRVL